MAAEPSEEEISNFVSFTSTSREQAISYLKVSCSPSALDMVANFEIPLNPGK
jgi:hypothetical protein